MVNAVLLAALCASSGVVVPTDAPTLTARLLKGDLVSLDRAEAKLNAAKRPTNHGELGLLFALGRFVRCRPPRKVEPDESPRYRAARQLIQYEAVRVAQMVYDGRHGDLSLAALLQASFQTTSNNSGVIRWPKEQELWGDEVSTGAPLASLCPRDVGALASQSSAKHGRVRAQRERAALSRLMNELVWFPGPTASGLALSYLRHANQANQFRLPPPLAQKLRGQIERGPASYRGAGRFLLAALTPQLSQVLWQDVLHDKESTSKELSRARVHLAMQYEPDWPAVLRVATSTAIDAARPSDKEVLINSRVRAQFALGRAEALMTTGRRLLRNPGRGPLHAQSVDILMELATSLETPVALSWLEEVAKADSAVARHPRFINVARRALAGGRMDLAQALFDKLRVEVTAQLKRPRQASLLSELLGARAEVAYEQGDVEGFGGLLQSLSARADADGARPLARHAPHRAVATLAQSLLGRMVERRAADTKQAYFAAHLLDAIVALPKSPRHARTFAAYVPTLTQTAGKLATGRRPPPVKRPPPPVKRLGEVVLPRLPPRLPFNPKNTRSPFVDAMVVYQGPQGDWRQGAFWRR